MAKTISRLQGRLDLFYVQAVDGAMCEGILPLGRSRRAMAELLIGDVQGFGRQSVGPAMWFLDTAGDLVRH